MKRWLPLLAAVLLAACTGKTTMVIPTTSA